MKKQENESSNDNELLIDPKIPIPVDEYIEEESNEQGETVRRKGVYLLPNLFTTAALFSGFYSIVNAMRATSEMANSLSDVNSYFIYSAIAIFIAMIMDGLDGRVARLTGTQSAFGAEYDSLSDMVAFGIAPAILAFQWTLSGAGNLGWMVSFIYVACAALRLARFNTQIGSTDKKYFIGLASPSAAAVVAASVWSCAKLEISGEIMLIPMLLIVSFVGVLMVSNIKYYSFKNLDFKGRIPFVGIIILVLCFAITSAAPSYVLLLVFLTYSISGPVYYLINLKKNKASNDTIANK